MPMNDREFPLFRHEEKFLITNIDAEIIKQQIAMICMPDSHTGDDGYYNIKSIYFDTINNKFLRETIDGVDIRHKYRIRAYNNDLSRITFEIKYAESGLKRKESDLISEATYKELIGNDLLSVESENTNVIRKIQDESLLYPIVPVVMVGYKRMPFVHPMGNVRITFDSDIIASSDLDSFYESDIKNYTDVLPGMQVLEVKYDEFLPRQIRNILNRNGLLNQTAFSKYANARETLNKGAY